MALLFGCVCNQPKRLHDAVTANGGPISGTQSINRWGIGYAQSGQLLLSRHPKTAEDFSFEKITEHIQADYVIGVAENEDGLSGNSNTQPFRYHSWLFAQSPKPNLNADTLGHLKSALPGFLQRSTKGRHPSEIVFHSFLSVLHETKKLDDARLSAHECLESFKSAFDNSQHDSQRDAPPGLEELIGNTVVTNSRIMMAFRCSAEPMYFTRFTEFGDSKRPETEFRSIMVWSGQQPESVANPEMFEEIDKNNVLLINRDLSIEQISL